MNVDSIRDFCLAFPQAKESLQWGETLCFKVRGKIFAMLSLDAVPPGLCLKCTPGKFEELLERDGIVRAPYVGRYNWVLLQRLDALPFPELKEIITQSYELVAVKAPKGSRNKKTAKTVKRSPAKRRTKRAR